MARRHYLVSYDISDDKRRNKVFDILEGQGDRVQYSVFFCDLSSSERVALESELTSIINSAEDQIIFADLGLSESDLMLRVEAVGRPYQVNSRSTIV